MSRREPPPFEPREIFAALSCHEVAYVTVGAFAVIAHGVVRATADVDIVPAPDDANRRRLLAALHDSDAHPDGEPEASIDLALLRRDANMRVHTRYGQLDLLCSSEYAKLYPRLRRGAIVAEATGIEIPVVGREDLLRLKAATGRDRDLLDIGDLLALDGDTT